MQNGYKHRLHLKKDLKHRLKKGLPFLDVFEIFLSVETSLWRQRTSCNVLSNVADFHDVISVINVQNIFQTY